MKDATYMDVLHALVEERTALYREYSACSPQNTEKARALLERHQEVGHQVLMYARQIPWPRL